MSQTHEKTNDKFTLFVPETRTLSRTPAGDATVIGASVRVPLSYFSRKMQAINPAQKDPAYAQLKPFIDDELTHMRESVARCIALSSANDVSIDTYVDAAPAMAVAPLTATSASSLSLMVGGHAKSAALGGLALMSLFMAFMMVRKATPSPLATISSPVPDKAAMIEVGEPLVGEASTSSAMLDGMELNEEAVKTNQMIDQVSTLVRENPETAATLVRKWLNRS
jgi:flagellar biosynthesis/type III secretory pathway M-ring protein FliF/YscJ